ncbi:MULTISPECIES: PAS and ANTAR domain-containing protein [Tsukamurella]|uniref:histidine kinase n=2 Tax=Tsukamurella TaxID=2060 RepID=A0A5C5S560_9ACTN|nr:MULTISPECIES: PAS and ANTAR domain-containing protein [Tsukamurella]NMD55669.1 ANTAR domain-containing protein [Tsukamurella columbiensis]TWS30369.1 ANTAR domain-containing protein [Tsukamurella conjunctivitidis]
MPPGLDHTWVAPDGAKPAIGTFRFYFDGERWEWSDEVALMHGYQPGTVQPTTALVLSHKHPDDQSAVAQTIENAIATRAPFSSRHRIIDTAGEVRTVVVVADRIVENGEVIGSLGVYVDFTSTVQSEVRSSLDHFVSRVTASRELIDCAKGMIMFVYGLPADRAFDLLRWRSQESNIKLRVLAEQLLADVAGEGPALVANSTRAAFDHLLLTGHTRVRQEDAG